MTDDRELLELAAKAAGGQARFDLSPDEAPWLQGVVDGRPQPYPVRWNPLADDGDALRLAVKLKIDVIQTNTHSPQVHALADAGVRVWEDSSADPLAATRRAITRAAAEIGEGMK